MARPPTTDSQIKLRLMKDLRERLDQAAASNRSSLNTEVVRRLEASFAAEPFRDLAGVAKDFEMLGDRLDRVCDRLEATNEALALGDLIVAELDNLTATENRYDGSPEQLRARSSIIRGLAWPMQRWRNLRDVVTRRFREANLPAGGQT